MHPANIQNQINDVSIISVNWSILPKLRIASYLQFFLFFFMIIWTILGTKFFVENDKQDNYYESQLRSPGIATTNRSAEDFSQSLYQTNLAMISDKFLEEDWVDEQDGALTSEATGQPLTPAWPTSISLSVHPSHVESQKGNQSKAKDLKCIKDTESYSFLISWCIINYFIILIFTILLLTWHDVSQKSVETRKNLLVILRQVNLHEQEGLDILENAIESVKDVINRRQDFVRTLNEYGIFLMQRGINNCILNE